MSIVYPKMRGIQESGPYTVGTVFRTVEVMKGFAVVTADTPTDMLLCEILEELRAIRLAIGGASGDAYPAPDEGRAGLEPATRPL